MDRRINEPLPASCHSSDGHAGLHVPILTTKPRASPAVREKFISSDTSPGQLAPDLYTATLPWWRAAIRTKILKTVERESHLIARMQEYVRSPKLDAYFVYTSSLGTHTFFMTALPIFFFFAGEKFGRGLLFVLAFGVYLSSVLKDFICSPRPFAPPVTRLTIGTHHLEYGFPSTHSTNSVSIALFIFSHIYHYYVSSSMSSITFYTSCALLFVYTFSIVFGRLYTAMHSFTDCAVGVLLGIFIWTVHWAAGEWMERWLKEGGWIVPLTIIPFCLLLVNQHPQPVDDCPCFEDAIAFISVIMGAALAQWHRTHYGMDEAFFSTVMAGSDGKTWEEVFTWWSIAGAKIVVGVLIIFVWRLVAKSALHFILPPLFRALALCFTLPSRRFYTPATDYEHVPMETGLHPIPSVIDLPGQMEMSGLGEPFGRRLNSLKQRRPGRGQDRSVSMSDNGFGDEDEVEKNGGTVDGKEVKHYDADVLTKVVVYAGIALLATEGVPVMFEVIGWGVRPW